MHQVLDLLYRILNDEPYTKDDLNEAISTLESQINKNQTEDDSLDNFYRRYHL